MGFVIDASAQQPVTIFDYDLVTRTVEDTGTVTAPVRVYLPGDSGMAWVQVRMLTGELANELWWVPRDRLKSDGNPYVKDQEELENLARAMSVEHFVDADKVVRPVPFQNPAEKCSERAELMALRLEGSGYLVEKILLIDYGVLRPYTIFGNDPPTLNDRASVDWVFHIAPLVYLNDDTQPYVFDPSLLDGPGTTAQWAGKMTNAQVEGMTYKDMVTRLKQDGQWPMTPEDWPWLVTAPARCAGPPDIDELDDMPEADWDGIAYFLQAASDWVPVRRAAAALNILLDAWRKAVNDDASKRQEANPYTDYRADIARARAVFGEMDLWARQKLLENYPNLRRIVRDTFAGSGIEADIFLLFAIIGVGLTTVG